MIKIFLVYHKPYEIFQTDVLEPIQSGCNDSEHNLGILKDNSGENISNKNKHFGEMTCWYWVWKNFLPQNPNLKYVGFGHYRRILAFPNLKQKREVKKLQAKSFRKKLKNYTQENIKNEISDYDIILFEKTLGKCSIEEYYKRFHPSKDWDIMKDIFIKKYPQYRNIMNKFISQNDGFFRCNFIMKKDLFEDFMLWTFDLLNELEEQCDWTNYQEYSNIRVPAYIIERFFNIWVEIKKVEKNIKIKEQKMYVLYEEHTFIRFFKKIYHIFSKLPFKLSPNGNRNLSVTN